jgi:hypothetical protein
VAATGVLHAELLSSVKNMVVGWRGETASDDEASSDFPHCHETIDL